MHRGIFRAVTSFDETNVRAVPHRPGVYIVYDLAGPIYVGRSRRDIHERLWRHLHGQGNRNLAMAMRLRADLTFEYEWLASPEQTEAQLIRYLGVEKFANLRREADPADRE